MIGDNVASTHIFLFFQIEVFMKHVYGILFFLLALMAGASAQVKFEYYSVEDNYYLLNIPTNSTMLARYDIMAPTRISEISVWFVTTTTGGTADLVLFGREGGYQFPYLMKPLAAAVTVTVPPGTDSLFRFQLPAPVAVGGPGQFFVGVTIRNADVKVRMDRVTQAIPCANSQRDSMYTNSFAQYNAATSSYSMGAWFSGQVPINNWYIGAAGEYYDENPSTYFYDATVESGLNVAQSTNPRVAWGDYNGDGWQDLLSGNRLYRNKGDGTFEDVAASAGYTGGSQVQMFADIDNDGDLDIVCQPANLVYINTNGTFTLGASTGLVQSVNTQAMCFADYNNDTYPDLFVANGEYLFAKNPQDPADSARVEGAAWTARLYDGGSGLKFTEKTANLGGYAKGQFGRNPYNTNQTVEGYRPSTSAQWIDYDGDGDADLFVGNDRLQPNSLYENQGTPFFRSVGATHNAQGGVKSGYSGLYGNTRGCDFGDYNNDGTHDLLTGEMALPFRLMYSDITSIWKNDATLSNSFANMQLTAKLGYTVYQADVAWADVNNDGRLDFYVSSGERCAEGSLYIQNADYSFTDVAYTAGLRAEAGFGVAWADFDNDGDLDLAIGSEFGFRLFRNELTSKGNWVQLNLKGKTGNSHAIGARARVYAGGVMYTRAVTAGKGAGSQQPYVLHIGLGSATAIDSVVIRWPNKKLETVKNLDINKIHSLTEKTSSTAVDNAPAAKRADLQQNYPNPFSKSRNGATNIAYNLPSASTVTLEIFDLRGARIKVLNSGPQAAGMHFTAWDGRNDLGDPVPSGTYQYVLSSSGVVLTKQLVVLK